MEITVGDTHTYLCVGQFNGTMADFKRELHRIKSLAVREDTTETSGSYEEPLPTSHAWLLTPPTNKTEPAWHTSVKVLGRISEDNPHRIRVYISSTE